MEAHVRNNSFFNFISPKRQYSFTTIAKSPKLTRPFTEQKIPTGSLSVQQVFLKHYQTTSQSWVRLEENDSDLSADSFQVISYNIWNEEKNRGIRMETLLKQLKHKNADLIFLCECTQSAREFLEKSSFIRKKYYMLESSNQDLDGSICILSRIPTCTISLYDLPWTNCKAVSAHFSFKMERNLSDSCDKEQNFQLQVIGVQLSNDMFDEKWRREQLKYLHSKIRQDIPTLLLGDFGFYSESEGNVLEDEGFCDVWKMLRFDEEGFTLSDEHRTDRIYARNLREWYPADISLLDNRFNYDESSLIISQHKGLHAVFRYLC